MRPRSSCFWGGGRADGWEATRAYPPENSELQDSPWNRHLASDCPSAEPAASVRGDSGARWSWKTVLPNLNVSSKGSARRQYQQYQSANVKSVSGLLFQYTHSFTSATEQGANKSRNAAL